MSVKTKVFIKSTVLLVGGKHRDVLPVSGVPVWVIITFFGAFITMSVSVWILSGTRTSYIIFHVLIGREQTYVWKISKFIARVGLVALYYSKLIIKHLENF